MTYFQIILSILIHQTYSATDSSDLFQCPARCDVLREVDDLRGEMQVLRQMLNQEALLRMTLEQKIESRKMFLEDSVIGKINSTLQDKREEAESERKEISLLKSSMEQMIENQKKAIDTVNRTLFYKNEETRSDLVKQKNLLEAKMVTLVTMVTGDFEKKITAVNSTLGQLISETGYLAETIRSEVQQLSIKFNRSVSYHRGNTTIAFTVAKVSNIKDYKHRIIIYDKILINQGDAYNKTSGIFTCPITGTDVFTWSVMSGSSQEYYDTFIYHNGTRLFRSYSLEANGSFNEVSSNTMVMSLTIGERVWIQTDTCKNGFGYPFTGFSGWKL